MKTPTVSSFWLQMSSKQVSIHGTPSDEQQGSSSPAVCRPIKSISHRLKGKEASMQLQG